MSQFLTVKADVDKAQKALSGTAKSLKSISRQTLGIIAKQTVKAIKIAIKSTDLKRRTGELQKAYRYKVKKTGNEANVFPKALNGESSIFPKVMALSYGVNNGNRHIKPRGFVQSGLTYIDSGEYSDEVEKMIQKELNKYWM